MTYAFGWTHAGRAYLVADSAITKATKNVLPMSSFGQASNYGPKGNVEESLLKIVRISANTAVAFAGDVESAGQILTFMRDNAGISTEAADLLQLVSHSLGPFDSERVVELLVATSSPGLPASLTRWSTLSGIENYAGNFQHIGNVASPVAIVTPQLVTFLTANNVDPAIALCIGSAIAQSFTVNDNTMKDGIGGLFFGLECFEGEVAWQDDTHFLVYHPKDLGSFKFVSAVARKDAVGVSSSFTNSTTVMAHPASYQHLQLSLNEWIATSAEMDSPNFANWVFLSTAERVVTYAKNVERSSTPRLVKLTNLGKGNYGVAVHGSLQQNLLEPLEIGPPGSLPFRLNVRTM